jgi:ribosomal protein S12 methylthiotransferase accessory factor
MTGRAEKAVRPVPRSQLHRRHPVGDALRVAWAEVERLGFTLDIVPVGAGDYRTYAAALLDGQGRVKARSSGKGFADQALASGVFEALEHYHMTAAGGGCSREGCSLVPAGEVAGQAALRGDRVVQRMRGLAPRARIGCGPYQSPAGDSGIWYPLAIADVGYRWAPLPGDDFDYRSLLRYCSTSGLGAGAAVADAVEHATFELIERDAVSLALLRWFVRREPPVRRVDPGSLPTDLARLLVTVERETGGPVVVADVTSDLGIPAYLAFPERSRGPANIAGSGASTDPAYALERALGEVLQELRMLAHYGTASVKFDQAHRVERWDRLRRCLALDWRWLNRRLGTMSVGLSRPLAGGGDDPGATARRALETAGLTPFWRRLSPAESAIAVVHVTVPGLEGFALVRTGHPVVPTGRGVALWPRAARAEAG